MKLTVYLAGEIHSNWRSELRDKAAALKLPLEFVGPMENHERSDNIGEDILGEQPNPILKDAAASQINNLRTGLLMKKLTLSSPCLVRNINSGILPWTQAPPFPWVNRLF